MPRVGDDPVARGQCRRRGGRMIDRRERPSAIVRPEPDSANTKSRRRVALLTDRAQVGAALARASQWIKRRNASPKRLIFPCRRFGDAP